MTHTEAKPRVVCISQARMSSSRLPGKILKPVLGQPLLYYHVSRLQQARLIDQVVVATSDDPSDDATEAYCEAAGFAVFRGPLDDVLARYTLCAAAYEAEVVVRTTGDCPLIDPVLVDACIEEFLTQDPPADHWHVGLAERLRGLDAEVFWRRLLDLADREATEPHQREHVTPFLHQQPSRFRLGAQGRSNEIAPQRWCVDEPADFELLVKMLEELTPTDPDFGWQDCVRVIDEHPEWATINSEVRQRTLPDGPQK